jgi:hypothetical protein
MGKRNAELKVGIIRHSDIRHMCENYCLVKAIHRTLHLKWQTGYRIQAQHTADRTGKVCIRATKRARVQSRILGGLYEF